VSAGDVVIAGAGPTGLALACGLLAAGVPTRVVDKADGPAITSRALGLQPRGVEVLDRLAALGDLPQRSVAIAEIAVNINGRQAARLPVGRPTRLVTRPGLLISQAKVEAQLRRRSAAFAGGLIQHRVMRHRRCERTTSVSRPAPGHRARLQGHSAYWPIRAIAAMARTGEAASHSPLLIISREDLPSVRWITPRRP